MNPYVRTLASLKLTIILLILIAVALSAGTIIESIHGTEAARSVYFAPWFFALQALFAVNILGAIWERFPRDRYRIGFLITHASMILILGGALGTALFVVDGRLPLWEGDSSARILRGGPDEEPTEHAIPFRVRLDAFEIDKYPGTERPAMFRSRVTVIDASGAEHPAIIEMNRPLTFGGYSFFQSSYQIERGREMSILSVSKDPGQPFVFWGYALLVLGMIIVLITRAAQTTRAEREAASGTISLRGAAVRRRGGPGTGALLLLAALLAAGSAGAAPAPDLTPRQLERIRRLPVQHDGRTMPLDTQAREAVRVVTGAERWKALDPVSLVISWTTHPEAWLDEPIVRIDGTVAAILGRSSATRFASYRTLLSSEPLRSEIAETMRRQETDQKPAGRDKKLMKLDERLGLLDVYLRGEAIRPMPAEDRVDAWTTVGHMTTPAAFADLEARVRPKAPPHYPSLEAIEREVRYNAFDATGVAWLLLLPAAIAAGMTLERNRWGLEWVARAGLLIGFAIMTWGIATRWQIAERIPASNMYESMLFLGWGVGLFGVISLLVRNRMLVFNAAAMSALAMILLDRLPIDPFLHPMPPVLSGTPWLAIHVPIIMVSYSVFAIATFLSHLVLGVELFAPGRRALSARWSSYLYWYIVVGSILLIAGILTGSIWAASSWGRYWGWDPKEVWSLIAFLAYMAILHARFDGMLRPVGVAIASIAAFWTILMTYLGVNFVLASGLHSYGFGSSNLVRIMGIILLAESAFVFAAWWAYRRRALRA